MKRIFITGSSGFIGRNLVEQLNCDYEIVSPRHQELDLLDTNAVEKFLREGFFDVVIHAANVNDARNKDITLYDVLNGNLRMFFNLERCRDLYGKMLYFGSGAEYGMEHYIPSMSEEYLGTYIPKDAYGFSKYIMAKSCEEGSNIYDLVLFGVYGKYEEYERRFISNNIWRNLQGGPMTLSQNAYFDYIYVNDLIRIIKWFIENEPKYHRYNVCRGEKVDLLSLAKIINEVMGTDTYIDVEKNGWKLEYMGNNTRLLKEIGEIHFTKFQETIKILEHFYREMMTNGEG